MERSGVLGAGNLEIESLGDGQDAIGHVNRTNIWDRIPPLICVPTRETPARRFTSGDVQLAVRCSPEHFAVAIH